MTSTTRPRAAAILVWLVWAAALGGILLAIARDGRNVPFEEDWLMVGAMTGHQPDLPGWLWSQNSEHRLPLPRLVNLALLRTTGDFRATMAFDAFALAAVCAGMVLLARALRGGRTSLADAFFPLLLLHLGNWDNLVWAWQIQFVLPTVLACAFLLVIAARPGAPSRAAAVAGALALVCLPLSGANGLVLAPPLALWFGYLAWVASSRVGGARWPGRAAAGAGALIAVLLCGVYFIGYQSSPWNAPSPGPAATLATSGKFLAFSVGPIAEKSWPLFGAVVAAILLACFAALAQALKHQPEERLRVLGLLAFLGAAVLLALAVGWGRAGRTAETGRMPTRYVLLAAPGMCAAYFTLLLYARGRGRRAGPPLLAAMMAVLFPLNTWLGLKRRDWFGAGFAAFERDLAAGAPAVELARTHHGFMLHWDEALMDASLHQLHQAGIGPFARWQPDR